MKHTIAHALRPAECRHDMREIAECVMCGRWLTSERQHVDTCGQRCFAALRERQR